MKLIVQIPCYNEEQTLPLVLNDIPKEIEGVDKIEVLVISDGSDDKTASVAKANGVDHILVMPSHRGLAEAFRLGLDKALVLGADIIVNTDGDNQYNGNDIPKLIKPIIEGDADIVIGSRDISSIKHFSMVKKILQFVGSYVVRKFSNTDIKDTTSGFRAYRRDAALRINVFSTYTYTIETIIQAGRKDIPMTSVDIRVNKKLRESRLIKSVPAYIVRSIATMLRINLMYEPLKSFLKLSLVPIIPCFALITRFLVAHFTRAQGGHVQSLVIAAIGLIMGAGILMIGLLGDIISANRRLNEEILYRMRKDSLEK